MESWDIAYEPRTGRRNHRATFPHLSSFLRFVFSFSFCGVEEHQPRITFAYTSHYRQDSLFGPNACESIELKRILSLKLSLRWKKEVKFFLYTFFFSFVFLEKWFVEYLHRQMITFSAKYSSCRTLENWFWDNYRR